jgi:hypothetical protein
LDQRLGPREVSGILDPEFEVTRAKVTDAANVSAEPLFELVAKSYLEGQLIKLEQTGTDETG